MTGEVLHYLEAHGVTAGLAALYDVRQDGATIHYQCHDRRGAFTRSRNLRETRKRTRQPRGRPLEVCYLSPPPRQAPELLLCEGEPDALAALQAKHTPPEEWPASRVLKLRIAFLPGTATPTGRILEEVERLKPSAVLLAFDEDHAGDAAAERLFAKAKPETVIRRLRLPDGVNDLAEALAASSGNRADALMAIVDGEA